MSDDREQFNEQARQSGMKVSDPAIGAYWRDRAIAAESQRDTLRTALIEAQSWIEGCHEDRRVLTPTVLARIREALEAAAEPIAESVSNSHKGEGT
jgi:hypothetical protein